MVFVLELIVIFLVIITSWFLTCRTFILEGVDEFEIAIWPYFDNGIDQCLTVFVKFLK